MKKAVISIIILIAGVGCDSEKSYNIEIDIGNTNEQVEVFVSQLKHSELPTWMDELVSLDPNTETDLPAPNCRLSHKKLELGPIENVSPTSKRETFTSYVRNGERIILVSENLAQENGNTYTLGVNLENQLSERCGFSQ